MPIFHEFNLYMSDVVGTTETKVYYVEDIEDDEEVDETFKKIFSGDSDDMDFDIDVEELAVDVIGKKVIDISNVTAWNESSQIGCTTLWFGDNFSVIVIIEYEEFTKLMEKYGYEIGR